MSNGFKIGGIEAGGFNGHSDGGHEGGNNPQNQEAIERAGKKTSALMRHFQGSTAMVAVLDFMASKGVYPLRELADQIGGGHDYVDPRP
ncbi:MAG: hypothetical protein AB8B83_00375 [Bdellovibrionales bacterium]